MRREFSNYVKAQAALRANGKCESCTARLLTGGYHYDHRVPAAMGGDASEDNCQVLCKACHGLKTTKADVPNIAKAKRRERKHLGIRPKSKFPCGKSSKFKRTVDGRVVLRAEHIAE
jgi:5-methylcytosine-specific restriction enzyme A